MLLQVLRYFLHFLRIRIARIEILDIEMLDLRVIYLLFNPSQI